MPLTAPQLDQRTHADLLEEAVARIPSYVPEWTDWNESDPGITLLSLQAWLTETLLFQLNRLPELNFLKFLQLLGVSQRVAQPAHAELTFVLREELDSPQVLIPKGTLVEVPDPELEQPLYFEADRALVAIAARLAQLVTVELLAGQTVALTDVTPAGAVDGQSFDPFPSTVQGAGPALLLGFSSPLPFSREEVGLVFYLAEEGEELLSAPPVSECGSRPDDRAAEALIWEWWDGADWAPLELVEDLTEGLAHSGEVRFRVPGQIPAVPRRALEGAPAFAPPTLEDVRELDANDRASLPSTVRTPADLGALTPEELAAALGLNLDDADDAERVDRILEDAVRLAEREPVELFYWLSVRPGPAYAAQARVDRIATNTVAATAARTVTDEDLGESTGEPNQVKVLANAPVLADPGLRLEIDEGRGPVRWRQVPDLASSGPDDDHFVLDRASGEVALGDGRFGRIPVVGATITARSYRFGGASVGNVGSGTITDLLTPIPEVEQVVNYRAASGGADEEPLADTMIRVPRELLRARERAVSLEDFEVLATSVPGAGIARAAADVVPGPEGSRLVRVVVVPRSAEAKPVPSEATLRRVCRYLDERRLVTTGLVVSGPEYHDMDVMIDARVRGSADLRSVREAIDSLMWSFLHPLSGGEDGAGWPFGEDVAHSQLVRAVMSVDGVRRLASLRLRKLLREYYAEQQAIWHRFLDLQHERDATGTECDLEAEVVQVTQAAMEGAVVTRWYTAATYDCCDMPVLAGALPAVRRVLVSVSYEERTG
jgi:predicted phage baseplate assembly protein